MLDVRHTDTFNRGPITSSVDCYTVTAEIDAGGEGCTAVTLPDGSVAVVMVLSPDAADKLLAGYDPASRTSPSAADSREIARPALEAMREAAKRGQVR